MARLIRIADWSGTKRGNVVFVHGLGGHPYDTWRRTESDGTFWPLWLAEEVKGISVFTLGYISPPTNWLGTALPLLDEAGHCLRILLNADDLREGPITFVCHSLGGLIVKKILRAANEQRANPAIADLLARTKQVVFIATPHTGSDKATLMERFGFLVWGSESARDLVANRPELRDLNFGYREFVRTRNGGIAHRAYYEMVKTLLGGIVAPDSADPGLPDCKPVAIREDHITIAKPRRRDELVYVETRNLIRTLAPEPADAGEMRVYPLEPFTMEWSWWQLVPKLVRLAAIVLLGLVLWQGVPRLYAALAKVEETHEISKESATKIDRIEQLLLTQAAKSGSPTPPPDVEKRSSEELRAAISELAKRTDDRSKRAFALLEQGDTKGAEALFAEIRDEKIREGQAANREAAQASRNIAAFTRLTNVAKAADLYAQATKLDPDNPWNWIDLGDMAVEAGRLDQAREAFTQALTIAERRSKSDPGNADCQYSLSASQSRVGNVLTAQGSLSAALDSYQSSLAIVERLAKSDPNNAEWQRNLSVSRDKIADVLNAQGNLPGALDNYQSSLAIRSRLAKGDPGDAQSQSDLSISYDHVGSVLSAQGNLAEALANHRASLTIRERLAKNEPGNIEWQRGLFVSYGVIGDVLNAQGHLLEALDSYQASLAIAERLAKGDFGNASRQFDLSAAQDRVGEVLVAQGNLSAALTSYRASLAIRERLVSQDRSNIEWQNGLSLSQNKIGNVFIAQGNLSSALDCYNISLEIAQRLAKDDPSNTYRQRDLAIALDKVSDVLSAQGDLVGALETSRASLKIAERLTKIDHDNIVWQRDLSASYISIGDLLKAQGDLPGALDSYRLALTIAKLLVKLNPNIVLMITQSRIGAILKEQGDLSGALDSYRSSLTIVENLANSNPGKISWQLDFAVGLGNVASIVGQTGEKAEALDGLQRGRAIIQVLIRQFPDEKSYQDYLTQFDREISKLHD